MNNYEDSKNECEKELNSGSITESLQYYARVY